MKENEFLDGVSNIDPDIVERFVAMDNKLQNRENNSKRISLRFGAIAACFVLILSAVMIVPILLQDDMGIKPYLPNGDPWSPEINAKVEDIVLSAEEVGNLFDRAYNDGGTNQYTNVYAASPEYLNITPLPNAEYLPIYSANKQAPSESELNDFIVEYLDSVTAFFGVTAKDYEIEEAEMWNGDIILEAEVSENKKGIRFVEKYNSIFFFNHTIGDLRMEINGEKVSILESDTDAQIKKKLENTITYVCTSFSKHYTDIKICRDYRNNQLKTITVYLYSMAETIFPTNFSEEPMTSDYIALTFYTDWGSGTVCDWGGSKEEAFLSEVALYQTSQKWNTYYTVDAKAKMIPLEEAEELLEKGYVFGGHSCPLCMAEQPEVDFTSYTYVDVEYISDLNGAFYIPFYAFYKSVGKNEHGMDTYAKTYVPAIQVSGYEEYFESQTDNHANNWYADEAG